MTFDWGEYLTLANDWAGLLRSESVSEEAYLRCALSRGYYASYHAAFDVATRKDRFSNPVTGNVHLALIQHLQRHGDPIRQSIGDNLDQLRKLRGRADYDDSMRSGDILKRNVQLQLLRADLVMREVRAL